MKLKVNANKNGVYNNQKNLKLSNIAEKLYFFKIIETCARVSN